MTHGVAILMAQVALVAAVRGWDKQKTIGKLRDVIAVINGEDPPAHSDKQKTETPPSEINVKDAAVAKQFDDFIKGLLEPPTDAPK